jgi:methyltransferase (TIGR00027 family)
VLTAVARSVHREESPPWVLDDYLALDLAGVDGLALREQLRAEVPASLLLAFGRWMCVRARLAEDLVARSVSEGVAQYVILGAGLDSFAYRRGDLLDLLRVFEVDHPANQSWKRRRLGALGVEIPAPLSMCRWISRSRLCRRAWRQPELGFHEPAVFSWLGTIQFRTLDAISATLGTIRECPAGSRMVITYNQPHSAVHCVPAQVSAAFVGIVSKVGEPFVSRFLPDEIAQLLHRHGFGDTADFGPEHARVRYFDGRTEVDVGGAERIVTATVMPHPEDHAPTIPGRG